MLKKENHVTDLMRCSITHCANAADTAAVKTHLAKPFRLKNTKNQN
jgi:hypothetical protein